MKNVLRDTKCNAVCSKVQSPSTIYKYSALKEVNFFSLSMSLSLCMPSPLSLALSVSLCSAVLLTSAGHTHLWGEIEKNTIKAGGSTATKMWTG